PISASGNSIENLISEMAGSYEIRYLTRNQLDTTKWDSAIDKAGNGLIYAYSFYLDKMSQHWDALVLNDYEAVMPLAWNRKYGISYIDQPFLTAQLGLFGENISPGILTTFLNAIPSKFKYWDFYLNRANVFALVNYKL